MTDHLSPPAVVRPSADPKAALKAAFAAFEDLGRRRLEQALVIGQLLAEQKQLCGHGNWLAWLRENAPFGRERAADFIRVYRERGKCGHLATFEEALQLLRQPDPSDRGDEGEHPDEPDGARRCERCARGAGHAADCDECRRGDAGGTRADRQTRTGSGGRKKPVQPELEFDIRAAAEAEARDRIAACREHAEALQRAAADLLAGPMPDPLRDELRRLGKVFQVPLQVKEEDRSPIGAPNGRVELVQVESWPAVANLVSVLALLSEQSSPDRSRHEPR